MEFQYVLLPLISICVCGPLNEILFLMGGVYNSGFSKLRMELFLRIDFHMKLLLGGAETFHGGNILVILGSTISIFAVCTYAYVHV